MRLNFKKELREISKSLKLQIKSTLQETHSGVIRELLTKVIDEVNCSLEMALHELFVWREFFEEYTRYLTGIPTFHQSYILRKLL